MNRFIVIYVLVSSVHLNECAKILGVFPAPNYSHFLGPIALLKELVARGHDVTVLNPYPAKLSAENYRHIELSEFLADWGMGETTEGPFNLFDLDKTLFVQAEVTLGLMLLNATKYTLQHKKVQQLLKSDQNFDLVIMEDYVMHALSGLAHHYKAPCILVHSLGLTRMASPQLGNPYNPSYMPDFFLPYSANMSLLQRVHNTLAYLFAQLFHHLYILPQHNALLQKHFPGAPHINELYYNASLTFLNSHVSTHPAVPNVPNMIDIGGIHITPPKALPKEIQDYLDGAKDGAILFSMGSNLRSSKFPAEKREAILKALGRLKERVLWKWEDKNCPGKPDNVKIEKWLPQSDILAHPNVKLFITHGGLLSQIETVYHGVPIVGIPVFADQKMNMANAEVNGIGISLPYSELTEESFLAVIHEVLKNPKYQENVKIRSRIMQDEPLKPLDKAVFWVEYVLRHNGATHLRTAALNLTWYQHLLLDVILFIAVVLTIAVLVLRYTIRSLFLNKKITKDVRKNLKRD